MGVVGCESQAFLKRLARVARRRIRPEGSWPSSCVLQLVLITRARTEKDSRKEKGMRHKETVDGSRCGPATVNGRSGPAAANGIRGSAYEAQLGRL